MGLGPGYMVSKHVKLVRLLGRGGMGSVWIADHLGLKTQVAVKFVSEVHANDPAMRARFQREATSAAQIRSPHIVNIHDHGITGDGIPYMVMELLDGEDLSVRLKRAASLPLDDVAKIISQTCKALGKAHRRGIVHRDIKPGNIFLLDTEGDLFVKVLDFGIAKPGGGESSEVTNTGMIVGTIVYSSPEQLTNARSVDFQADLWSLGVVAYRAMTGKLPFSDEDGIGALFFAMEAGRFVPPSQIVSTIPPEVDEWCKRAFEHNPAARFGSAREMANALYTALGRTSSPSLARAPQSETNPSARHFVVEESTGGGSIVGEVAGQEEKGTVLTKDPSSVGAASAMTYVGEAAINTSAPLGSGRRRVVIAAAVVACLVGAGALGVVFLKRPMKPLAGASAPSIENEPGGVTAAPASPTTNDNKAPPVALSASSRVELAPSTSAPSASVSNAPAPSASVPGASPKPSSRSGGPGRRNPLPEKDYGF